MPSPIAHLSVGYLLYRAFVRYIPTWKHNSHGWKTWVRLGAFLLLSMLPDFDAVVGILCGDMGHYHNQWTHSLLMAGAAALLTSIFFCTLLGEKLRVWIAACISCCGLHVLMDTICYGRGVLLLWPFSDQRLLSPILIFTGLHWSQGLWSALHLLTALNELFVVALLYGVTQYAWKSDN